MKEVRTSSHDLYHYNTQYSATLSVLDQILKMMILRVNDIAADDIIAVVVTNEGSANLLTRFCLHPFPL